MKTHTISVDYKKMFGSFNGMNIDLVLGEDKCLDVLYSIGYMRTFCDDSRTRLSRNVARIIKLFSPGLIVPWGYLKEDTRCHLKMEVVSVQNNHARLKYDISICNGGRIHKAVVRKMELTFFKTGLRLPVWFSFTDQYIDVDLRKCYFFAENSVKSVKDITFTSGRKCLIRYV